MIYGTLDHLEQYMGLPPRIVAGLEFLASTEFSTLLEDTIPIIPGSVTAYVKRYVSQPENDTPEAHQAYVDIQYLISGEEYIGVTPLADVETLFSADPKNDVWFYKAPTDRILLKGNRFVVFWPDDAHAPGIAVHQSVPCKKCVIKVRL